MKSYIVKCPLFIHKGRRYGAGETVILDPQLAANQIKNGAIIEPKSEEAK